MRTEEKDNLTIEGRNPVIECLRSKGPVETLYVLDGCHDGPVETAKRLAKGLDGGIRIKYLSQADMDMISPTGRHQGLIAKLSAREYASVEDILERAGEKGEPPFIVLVDGIEDPHNLGAIIRTAHQVGAHGIIIRENRAVGLSATVARTSAGALEYMPVAKVTNMVKCMEELKQKGLWFVCAEAEGQPMYRVDMKGSIGLVIGSEGKGVSRLVREHCDLSAAIPMKGRIDSLNASVAAGVLCYEVLRQREYSD